jgi:proline iminopeptidase
MTTFSSYDGTEISYRKLGNGPLLFCVPGGPRASAYLEDLGGLSAHRTLVRYDARGTGDSVVPADPSSYAYPALAEDLEALRAHLGVERMDLLAHSNGTVVAQAYAAKYPERVGRLVLIGPGNELYPTGGRDLGDILASRADEPWYAEVSQAAMELMSLPADASPERMLDVLGRYTPAGYGKWAVRQQEHAKMQQDLFSLTAWAGFTRTDVDPAGIVARLKELSEPVLVLTGDRDGLTGVAVGDIAVAAFTHGRHVTLDVCGHYPWVDQPQRFVQIVEDFLN